MHKVSLNNSHKSPLTTNQITHNLVTIPAIHPCNFPQSQVIVNRTITEKNHFLSHGSIYTCSSDTLPKTHSQSITLLPPLMNTLMDLTTTISLTKNTIPQNIINYIDIFFRHLLSFLKQPHPLKNMHYYRRCPILHRATSTTTPFLHQKHKKSLRRLRAETCQHHISNYNSLIYYYILSPVDITYNFLYTPSARNSYIPFTPYSTKKSHHTKSYLFTTFLPTHSYLSKYCTRCSTFLYLHVVVYFLCLTHYICHDLLIIYYLDVIVKINYVNSFYLLTLLLISHYLASLLARSTTTTTSHHLDSNYLSAHLSPPYSPTPTYNTARQARYTHNGHICTKHVSTANLSSNKYSTNTTNYTTNSDTNINNSTHLSTTLALMQHLTNPFLIINNIIYSVTADTLLTSTYPHSVPLHTIRHKCHRSLQTKDPFTDTPAPLSTAPTHQDLPTYTIALSCTNQHY